jgi:hypothetical protein
MKRKHILFLIALGFLLTIIPLSCENNNEFDLYGTQACDTINITWNSKIADILEANCVVCHGPEVANYGVRHDSYAAELVVVNDGRLRRVINDTDPTTRMPKDRGQLPDCELKLINKWLDIGAPEN